MALKWWERSKTLIRFLTSPIRILSGRFNWKIVFNAARVVSEYRAGCGHRRPLFHLPIRMGTDSLLLHLYSTNLGTLGNTNYTIISSCNPGHNPGIKIDLIEIIAQIVLTYLAKKSARGVRKLASRFTVWKRINKHLHLEAHQSFYSLRYKYYTPN